VTGKAALQVKGLAHGEDGIVRPPEMVRLGADVRDNLTTLKRRTGIANSNVLCRWALARSLAETGAPTNPPSSDTAVEIAWKVFSGTAGDLYWWLLKMHCHECGLPLEEAALQLQLRAHIARGASYLVGDKSMRDATSLAQLAMGGRKL
jgi:DNA sulfur modification protein DndE